MNTYRTAAILSHSFVVRPEFAPQRGNWLTASLVGACAINKKTFWLGLSLSVASLFTTLPAQAVVGGTQSAVPWAVQLVELNNHQISQLCVGAAINDHTIITTRHCRGKAVSFADRTVNVESRHDIKGTEIAVLFLTSPYALTEYAKLGPNYLSAGKRIPPGTRGTAYGFGSAYFMSQQSVGIKVHAHGPSPEFPEVIVMLSTGAGILQAGDSGAPLIIDGNLVGVLHGTAKEPPPPGSEEMYIFDGLSPALDGINALIYQRKARQFIASEEL